MAHYSQKKKTCGASTPNPPSGFPFRGSKASCSFKFRRAILKVLANFRRPRRNGARCSARGCPWRGRSGAGRSAPVTTGTGRRGAERRGWRRRGSRRRGGGSHSPPVRAIFRGAWPSSLRLLLTSQSHCYGGVDVALALGVSASLAFCRAVGDLRVAIGYGRFSFS